MRTDDAASSLNENSIINDKIDLPSLFSIFLDNFNLLISAFLVGIVLSSIIYLSSVSIYSSKSLIEIQQQENMFENSIPGFGNTENSLLAVAIYKSRNTLDDVVKSLEDDVNIDIEDIPSSNLMNQIFQYLQTEEL